MDFEAQNELRPALSHGERLLWTGKPKAGVIFRPFDIFLIPFSLVWFGFAIFWVASVLSTGVYWFALFGIPFLIIGFYISVGRFISDSRRRKNTVYGITNDRVVIKAGIKRPDIKSLNIKTISDITYNEKADGSGTIIFGPALMQNFNPGSFNAFNAGGSKAISILEFIPEVKKVYEILLRVQRDSLPG
ncbi:MAG: hypothetical protein WCF67_19425 [Chitinophagaceae bacterium]